MYIQNETLVGNVFGGSAASCASADITDVPADIVLLSFSGSAVAQLPSMNFTRLEALYAFVLTADFDSYLRRSINSTMITEIHNETFTSIRGVQYLYERLVLLHFDFLSGLLSTTMS